MQAAVLLATSPAKELHFNRPLKRGTWTRLTLANVSPNDLAYKIKTTSPDIFCCRPSSMLLRQGAVLFEASTASLFFIGIQIVPFSFNNRCQLFRPTSRCRRGVEKSCWETAGYWGVNDLLSWLDGDSSGGRSGDPNSYPRRRHRQRPR